MVCGAHTTLLGAPYTQSGACYLVTVQLCNAYDTTTVLKVSICNEAAAPLQNIAATLFHNSKHG